MTKEYRSPKALEDKDYMKVLKVSLKDHRKASRKDHPRARDRTVAIVGAGMAGLVSAWILNNKGFKIVLYEASSRVGGRIKTFREGFTSGLHAEAGAMRIPESHKLTRELCSHFNLKLIDFPAQNKNTWVFINGVRIRRSEYDDKNFDFGLPYIKGRTAKEAFKLTTDCLGEIYNKNEFDLDHISLGEYLRAFTKTKTRSINPVTEKPIEYNVITKADIDLIGLEFGAADLHASLLEAYRDHYVMDDKNKHQIEGGMDLLPQKIAETIKDDVCYNARVTEIKKGKEKAFKIYYEHTVIHRRDTSSADFVILAAPFSALTHVRLEDVLKNDPARLHAIRNLHYENSTKIALEFKKRFWEKEGIHGGNSVTDLPIRWVYYPSDEERPPHGSLRGILLASYTWGDDSLRWGSLNHDDRIRFALRDIAKLHKIPESKCEKLLVGGMSHSWAEDEYTFGAFCLSNPHQEHELFDATWKPYNGVYFAGEHTSLKHAWIEGAVESGIRVACEIYKDATDCSLW